MLPRLKLLLFLSFGLVGTAAEKVRPEETVGTLDFFGLRRVTETEVRSVLKLKEGDAFQRSAVKTIAAELEKIPGVSKATVTPITVDGTGKLRVFIGLQEEGAAGFTFHDAPHGEQRLPEHLAQIFRD